MMAAVALPFLATMALTALLRFFRNRPSTDAYSLLPLNEDSDSTTPKPRAGFPRQAGCSPRRRIVDTVLILALIAIVVLLVLLYTMRPVDYNLVGAEYPHNITIIDPKINARRVIDQLFASQSQTLAQAASRYRMKTNRAPPKNYDKWFKYAKDHSCLVDEYDQVWEDFEPFYQMEKTFRQKQKQTKIRRMEKRDEERGFFAQRVDAVTKMIQNSSPIGMLSSKVEGGIYAETDDKHGASFNPEWKKTIERFAGLLPDLNIILNGRDEPRILFNHREPDVGDSLSPMDRAFALSDTNPFKHEPSPTSLVYKNQKKCLLSNSEWGFTGLASDYSGFLIDSTSSDFTTDFYPLLSMTKISPCFSDILIPTEYYYQDAWWSPKYAYPDNILWSEKKAQLYWRGHGTGGRIHGSSYHNFSRFHISDIAKEHPDILNVQVTKMQTEHCEATGDCDVDAINKEYGISGQNDPREDGYKYKFVMDLDGNTFSGRYLGLLRSGSLIFKSTVFTEFFHYWLKPYVHFIPVRQDLSDLVEKVEWAIANDDEAKRIQELGREFSQRVMTDAQNDCYFFAVLLEWANLQDGLL
ncbi:glycosyl transferase family 90-domain-containing protein [Mycena floridula]|nr:glycosyl transferase family 90-domain-containing protein [Mycena floridula]